jgi:extracellular factor (EF) 3-hydroxypalmitic acid methyl ester biosynthesis protein
MVFGSPLNREKELPKQDAERLLAIAREAGEQLLAGFERARSITRDWADARLTDALVDSVLSSCLHQLAETGCWGEANRLPSNELWRIAGPILEVGVLQKHARFKPHGYAGDYEMLHKIYTHYSSDHPLGTSFDRYFQRQAAPQAVRERVQQTARLLAAHKLQSTAANYSVVSIGSGPADDICQALAILPENRRRDLHVTLLDLDPEALDFSKGQAEQVLGAGGLTCVRENLYRLPQNRRASELLGSPDFLICSGLFDYLEDQAAVAMLRLFWERLAAGGLMLVGNFAPHNPTRAFMEWIGNWYLTYRTGDDLERLGNQAGIPRVCVSSEPLGVDLFLTAMK